MFASEIGPYNDFLMSLSSFNKEIINAYVRFLTYSKKESSELHKIRQEYNLQEEHSFNIFLSISDKYKQENLHSDFLSKLLDPHTVEIGQEDNLRLFINLLSQKNKLLHDFVIDDKIVVERECGKIDIFIHNEKQGIIIENKINNAPYQEDQLARYLEFAQKKHIEVLAFVYIPPIDFPFKKPPIEDHSENYKKYTTYISERLIILPVIDTNGIDLVHDFLDKVADKVVKESPHTTTKVVVKQYSNLLKGIGEKSMSKGIKKRLLEKIYENEENIAIAMDITETMNERGQLLGEIIGDKLVEQEHFVKVIKDDGKRYNFHKYLQNEVSLNFDFILNEKNTWYFGLWSEKTKWKKKFREILSSENFRDNFGELSEGGDEDADIYRPITMIDNWPLNKTVDFFIEKYKYVENNFETF